MSGKLWTPVEKIILRGYYRDYPVSYWAHLLPGRTKGAMGVKARRIGLSAQREHRAYYVNDYYFTNLTPEKCYWGGFLAADGYISDTADGQLVLGLRLHEKDIHHVKMLRGLLAPSKPIYQTGCYAGINITSNRIAADLKRHFNIVPRKSLILQPPNIEDEDLVFAYIAGYFDGDGSVQAGRTLNFVAGTPNVLVWIKEKLGSVRYGSRPSPRVYAEGTEGKKFRYCVGKGRVRHFVKRVQGLNLPLLERKWEQITRLRPKKTRFRQVRAWRLRQNGLVYREIAERLGYASPESARCATFAIQKLSKEHFFSSVEEFIEANSL